MTLLPLMGASTDHDFGIDAVEMPHDPISDRVDYSGDRKHVSHIAPIGPLMVDEYVAVPIDDRHHGVNLDQHLRGVRHLLHTEEDAGEEHHHDQTVVDDETEVRDERHDSAG